MDVAWPSDPDLEHGRLCGGLLDLFFDELELVGWRFDIFLHIPGLDLFH